MDAPTPYTPAPATTPDAHPPVASAPSTTTPAAAPPLDVRSPEAKTDARDASGGEATPLDANDVNDANVRELQGRDASVVKPAARRIDPAETEARSTDVPRPSATQADLDDTLGYLERLCGRLEQAESRFKQLTDECEGVLKGLVAVDRRHSTAIANLNDRLGDWCHLESKLLEESARRIEQFERGVGHEWMVLRQLHEEPLVQLKDDADQLRMACLEAARTARHRFDSVEKAYSAYTEELDRRLNELSRELLGAVTAAASARLPPALPAGSSSLPAPAPPAPVEPWPLEGVAQLHHEIRTGTPQPAPAAAAAVPSPATDAPPTRPPVTKRVRILFGILLLLVVALGGYAVIRSRSPLTTETPANATTQAAEEARADTAAGAATSVAPPGDAVSEAQRVAERAGTMVDILAAADLRRYTLAGAALNTPNQPYGQLLWSRSRGLAASASRLPALPAGKVYRLWIVPDGPAVSAGVLVPDAAGRASLLVAGPLTLPVPVTIRVTIEDKDETTTPKGPVCLVRVPGA